VGEVKIPFGHLHSEESSTHIISGAVAVSCDIRIKLVNHLPSLPRRKYAHCAILIASLNEERLTDM